MDAWDAAERAKFEYVQLQCYMEPTILLGMFNKVNTLRTQRNTTKHSPNQNSNLYTNAIYNTDAYSLSSSLP